MCHGGQLAILKHLDNSPRINRLRHFSGCAKNRANDTFKLLQTKELLQMCQIAPRMPEIMTHPNSLILLKLCGCFIDFCFPLELTSGGA